MNDPQDSELRELEDQVNEALALCVAPAELQAVQRDRLRERILIEASDRSPPGTVTVRAQDAIWTEVAPFIQMRVLGRDLGSGDQTALVRMQAGACVPAHRHLREEEFTVLEGECWIGTHRLRAGDVHVAAAGSWHDAVTTQTGVLVFLRGEYPLPDSL